MSMHERVYEGTLYWPLDVADGKIVCMASKSQPPYPGYPEEPAADPCKEPLDLDEGEEPVTIAFLVSVLEQHMRNEHGQET